MVAKRQPVQRMAIPGIFIARPVGRWLNQGISYQKQDISGMQE